MQNANNADNTIAWIIAMDDKIGMDSANTDMRAKLGPRLIHFRMNGKLLKKDAVKIVAVSPRYAAAGIAVQLRHNFRHIRKSRRCDDDAKHYRLKLAKTASMRARYSSRDKTSPRSSAARPSST